MTRTAAREIAVQVLFAVSQTGESSSEALERLFDREYFSTLAAESEIYASYPGKKQREYIETLVQGVLECQIDLDDLIEKYAKGWKLGRISNIAATIMRVAMYEVLYMDEVPDKVAVNEAVEMAKGYEEPETVSFINGVLGSFLRGEKEEGPSSEPPADAPADEQEKGS